MEPIPSSAFEEIYRTHADGIYRFLYKMSSDAQLSEELTQETFYRAFLSLSRYNGRCALFTWLAAIAKNLYFAHRRKGSAMIYNDELLLDEPDPDSPDPLQGLLREERAEALRRALLRLPHRYRDVVILRAYASLPYSQIAAHLGISENSAKVLFFRAKSKLKEELLGEHL